MAKKFDIWELIGAVLGVTRRLLLYGPPGTGKSWAGTRNGLTKGQNVYVITVTEEMSMSEIRGHYIPSGGKFIWQHGVAILAWINGARLVINEIDKASGDVATFLHAILDDPELAGMSLPTGEFVQPKEGFQVVATMNGVPEDLEDALRDRFPVALEVNVPSPDAIKSLPKDLQDVASKSINADPQRRISLRAWAEFGKLRGTIGIDKAAQSVFGARADDVLNSLKIAKA